ncbi:MAG: N-acetylmuramoyl-L-alanine amidase [Bacteroides sp.]
MRKRESKILGIALCFCLFTLGHYTTASAKEFVVVIDAGHGGHDPGAVGSFSKEKNINLSVALNLGNKIKRNCDDVKVIYTRQTDVFIPLDRRADIANNAKADLFISIHTNAVAKGKTVQGAETFTLGLARSQSNLEIAKRENSVILIEDDYKKRYAGFNPNSSESYIMFEFIQDKHMEQSVHLATLVQKQFRSYVKRVDRGVHQAGFLVLRATTMPSVLIELGYISTPSEERFLNTQEGINNLGNGIYNAFLKYRDAHAKPLKGDVRDIMADESDSSVPEAKETEKPDTSFERKAVPANEETPLKEIQMVASASSDTDIIFKIQFLTSSKVLKKGDSRFKGLSPINFYQEQGIYKYTYMESNDYNKVLRAKREIASKFKDAFIVAFKSGEKVDIRKAIAEFKKNRNKK